LAAVQALYQMDLSGSGISDTVAEFESIRFGQEIDGDEYLQADVSWFRGLVAGVVENQKTLDPAIHGKLPSDWPLARIDTLLRAILRSGAFELSNRADVPSKVIISEYLEVAKAFFDGDEPKLVNALLDSLARDIRSDDLQNAQEK
jgi:N utilization substance protein B